MGRRVVVIVDEHSSADQVFPRWPNGADAGVQMARFRAQHGLRIAHTFAPDAARVTQCYPVFAEVKIGWLWCSAGDDHAVVTGGFQIRSEIATGGGAAESVARRRTEIARALATEPQYILLDEPFAGIDPKAVDDIQNVIIYLRNRGIGILVTDHNVRETLGVTDRAYIMAEGKIFRSGQPRDLTEDAEVRRLYLGEKFRM